MVFVNCGRISIVIIIIIIISSSSSSSSIIITIWMDLASVPHHPEGLGRTRKDSEGPRCRTHGRLARSLPSPEPNDADETAE